MPRYTEDSVQLNQTVNMHATIVHVFYSSGSWASVAFSDDDGEQFRGAGQLFDAQLDKAYMLTGSWTVHEKYGLQFTVASSKPDTTVTKEGIIAFLSSGLIKGLGPKKAEAIYDTFGLDTYKVIENEPHRLTEVKGITERMIEDITSSYRQHSCMRQVREFFPPEISDSKVILLYRKYGERTIQVMKENPYHTIKDVEGIGFLTADRFAMSLGLKQDDPRRVNAGIIYCLREMQSSGHCYSYTDNLQVNLLQLIGDVPVPVIADEVKKLKETKEIVIDEDGAIYYAPVYYAEVGVANCIKKMLRNTPKIVIDDHTIDTSITEMEERTGFRIEHHQIAAVKTALNNCLSIITGGPGTGKTTIIQLILAAWEETVGTADDVAMAAPTGKAARRMSEVTQHKATTIHGLLGHIRLSDLPDGADTTHTRFRYNKDNPSPYNLIIIDEASMLDITMAYALVQAVADGCRIVLIGDIDQLPPIGPGNFFRDMVTSYQVPSVKLELSFRQEGKIAINAQKINCGEGAHAYVYDDTFQFKRIKKDQMQETTINEYLKLVQEYGLSNCCLLSPMRTRSSTGTELLNRVIQDRLNPETRDNVVWKSKDNQLRLGDRIMQIVNNWDADVANGDMGYISSVEGDFVTVSFDSGVQVTYRVAALKSNVALGYAITVHKAQGSEYQGCVVACNSEHWFMAQRNLLYTAVTRAKKKVVLCGDAKTIARAVDNVQPVIRNTKLKIRLA